MPSSSIEALVARTSQDQQGVNTIVVLTYPVRFQLAPGAANGLGIVGADFVVTAGGVEIANGTTDANGEVQIPIFPLFSGPVTVTIFETDYVFSFHPEAKIDALAGVQQRLEKLGYMSGYLLAPLGSAATDTNKDDAKTQQALMNFQCDENLTLDGRVGPETRGALASRTET
jgi:hypothetical protein